MDTVDLKGTIITLRDTDYPGAEAELFINNQPRNNIFDNGVNTLDFEGLSVDVSFIWHSGPDEIRVIPPEGYICLPSCEQIVQEMSTMIIYLMPWLGV